MEVKGRENSNGDTENSRVLGNLKLNDSLSDAEIQYKKAETTWEAGEAEKTFSLLEQCVLKYKDVRALKKWAEFLLQAKSGITHEDHVVPLSKAIENLNTCDGSGNNQIRNQLRSMLSKISEYAARKCEALKEDMNRSLLAANLYFHLASPDAVRVPQSVVAGLESCFSQAMRKSELEISLNVFRACNVDIDSHIEYRTIALYELNHALNSDDLPMLLFATGLEHGMYVKAYHKRLFKAHRTTRKCETFSIVFSDTPFMNHVYAIYTAAMERMMLLLFPDRPFPLKNGQSIDENCESCVTSEVVFHDRRVVLQNIGRVAQNAHVAAQIYQFLFSYYQSNPREKYYALNRLAMLLERGSKIPQDISRAKEYFNRAIPERFFSFERSASNNLGVLLALNREEDDSFGTPCGNLKDAEILNMSAKSNLAVLHERGLACAKDPSLALSLYEEAIACDHPGAMYNLGVSLKTGDIGIQDSARADELFDRVLENKSRYPLMPNIIEQSARLRDLSRSELISLPHQDLVCDEHEESLVLIKVLVSRSISE